ncbi:TPD1 protein homolog 1-like [Wolffia australiana]
MAATILPGFSPFSSAVLITALLVLFFPYGEMVLFRHQPSRRMLQPSGRREEEEARTNRMDDGACTVDDIDVFQEASSPLPSGIPSYTVQIINTCVAPPCDGGAAGVSEVHLRCGWFSSARLVNPKVFRRVGYDDCLVNDGRSIPPGAAVSFQYANSFPYPLAVSSASCQPCNLR